MRTTIRRTHLAVATFAIVALALAALTWSQWAPPSTQAANEQAKTQMDIVITGTHGGAPVICDSATQSKCTLGAGTSFTVDIVPSTIPVGGYLQWATLLDYGTLLYKPTLLFKDEQNFAGVLPVRSPASPTGKEGNIFHGNLAQLFPPYTTPYNQKTSLVTLNFNCTQNAGGDFSQLLSLIPFDIVTEPDGTVFVLVDKSTFVIPNTSPLQINCVTPPTPTPTNTPTVTPTPTPTPTNTPTVTPTPPPTKQPAPGDTDQDGCSDQAENGEFEYLGGQRDYLYFWDFYDVWTHPPGDPIGWERNKVINIFDILAVARRFGPGQVADKQTALAAALTQPVDEASYHAAYDRGPIIGANLWDRGPPDGAINIVDDILGVAQQFGHTCE